MDPYLETFDRVSPYAINNDKIHISAFVRDGDSAIRRERKTLQMNINEYHDDIYVNNLRSSYAEHRPYEDNADNV